MKLKFTLEVTFESWCDPEVEPKDAKEWTDFMAEHLFTEGKVIGSDADRMVSVKSMEFTDEQITAHGHKTEEG
jgi:hypothetical protein